MTDQHQPEQPPRKPVPLPPDEHAEQLPLDERPAEPCPDPSKPYVWFDGEWLLVERDADVPELNE